MISKENVRSVLRPWASATASSASVCIENPPVADRMAGRHVPAASGLPDGRRLKSWVSRASLRTVFRRPGSHGSRPAVAPESAASGAPCHPARAATRAPAPAGPHSLPTVAHFQPQTRPG
jgi:hypothetical protein